MSRESVVFTPRPRTMRLLSAVALAGAAITVVGLLQAPERIWPSILLAGYYLLCLGLAGTLLVSLVHISNAGWAAAIRRVPEAMSANVYAGGVLMLLVLVGAHQLYEWTHQAALDQDPLLQSKAGWLNLPFFTLRTLVYLGVWAAGTWLLVRTSRRQDLEGSVLWTLRNRRYAALFTVVFSLTFWIASMDWVMSLEPHWYSTIFGIYNFSGLFLSGLAAVTLLLILLRRDEALGRYIREDHLHDLGKLIFAFSTFWMYIWFSQYLLIWYANIPEETAYFIRRESGGWGTFTVLNLLFNWVIPFVVLLSRSAKRNEGLLLKVCIALLIGRWIDLFWMILPSFRPQAPAVGLWEVGPLAGVLSLFVWVTYKVLSRGNAVPIGDPLLSESLHYHS